MGLTALILLHHRVDVAKPPLERVVLEDRRRPGRMIDGVDDLAPLMDRPGRGEADRGVVVDCEPPWRRGGRWCGGCLWAALGAGRGAICRRASQAEGGGRRPAAPPIAQPGPG